MIAAGHNFEAIKRYKLRQAQAFIELFKKRHSLMLKEEALAMRMAQHADGKDFLKFLEND